MSKKKEEVLTEEEKRQFCLDNGISEEKLKQLIENEHCTIDEIYNSAQSIIERDGAIVNDTIIFRAKLASEFGEDKTEFVWYPYIPVGDYTVLMADGGTGKTILCCGIIACLSKGEPLPNESRNKPPYKTLIISAEDRGELLKKRLLASGADLNEVYIIDCMSSEGLNFTDKYTEFVDTIKKYGPRLVIIDPWHAFLGADVDINRVNAVRPVFQSLANIAKACNCGMVLVSHVNKRAQGENANNAATGSTDFINAARSALRVIFSEEEENTRIVVHTKSNYAAAGKSVKYLINENGGCQWVGFSEITRKTLEEAARWKKKPNEVISRQHEQEETNRALIEAVRERAVSGETVNIAYDEMREEYGEDIFGERQPKKALDNISAEMRKKYDITIQTGKTVGYKGKTRNGFAIRKVVSVDEIVDELF